MTLALEDLTVTYGTYTAVNNITLTVPDGEILGLLGPSGCGKSTLLRAIAGLEHPTHGRITYNNTPMNTVPVHKRNFGLMFQDGQLFPHKNVAANIAYGLTTHTPRTTRPTRQQRNTRVNELLTLVGLTGYNTRDITTMSGGERQRVALARALAPHPTLLLLDEPLSALDKELRERLATDLRTILRTTNTTAIFVTHDQDEAFTICDRVAIMRNGTIPQIDTPEKLWRAPANRHIAEFLGYEAILTDTPFTGYAPGHHTITAINPPTTTPTPPTQTPTPNTTLTGTLTDRLFRQGHPMARVTIPTIGTLTCHITPTLDPQPGDTVTLTPHQTPPCTPPQPLAQ